MTPAVRHTAARTHDTAPARSAPPGTAEGGSAPAHVHGTVLPIDGGWPGR